MKIGYIFVVRLIETMLGNVFIWSSAMFYTVYRHAPEWGITPAHDLNLGGIVMMAEGSIVTLAVLVWLFLRLAAEGELRQRLLEQGSTRGRCSARCATAARRISAPRAEFAGHYLLGGTMENPSVSERARSTPSARTGPRERGCRSPATPSG